MPLASSSPLQMRALFLSDLHLGNAGSRADLLLAFLQAHRAQTYYLVGDMLDLALPFGSIWGEAQQAVIDHLHARQRSGARVVFVQGNHDPRPGDVPASLRMKEPVVQQTVHAAADGRRFLVVHGDGADFGPFQKRWLECLGMAADQVLRRLDRIITAVAQVGGVSTPGLMPGLMRALNQRLYSTGMHERQLVAMARDAGLDGVICGHFHVPALHDRHGQVYANCGDWLDNFVALGEDAYGNLRHLHAAAPLARRTRRGRMIGRNPLGA